MNVEGHIFALRAVTIGMSSSGQDRDLVILKGRVQVGADADIVVFNPDTVTDNSTFTPGEGALPSTGIPYVLVNGVVVVKDSVVQKVFPGKPIRFPVLEKGRLGQITIEPRIFEPNQ